MNMESEILRSSIGMNNFLTAIESALPMDILLNISELHEDIYNKIEHKNKYCNVVYEIMRKVIEIMEIEIEMEDYRDVTSSMLISYIKFSNDNEREEQQIEQRTLEKTRVQPAPRKRLRWCVQCSVYCVVLCVLCNGAMVCNVVMV